MDPEGSHWSVERLPTLALIRDRLPKIFPEGVDGRPWATAERAARSAFVFFYACAVEGVSERRVRPAMVTTMSDVQAATASAEDRALWWDLARRPRRPGQVAKRWYAENTREPIRDETFRVWKEYGALLEDALPTTSSRPRYRLAPDFAELFNPDLDGADLDDAIAAWQSRHLNVGCPYEDGFSPPTVLFRSRRSGQVPGWSHQATRYWSEHAAPEGRR